MTIRLPKALGLATAFVLLITSTESAESISLTAKSVRDAGDRLIPFPPRDHHALTGSEFLDATAELLPAERERAILDEIRSGNVPSHIRRMVPVQIKYEDHLATVYVLPDYLAVGSDDDYVIIPMAPRTAMQIASEFGLTLPTTKLVDEIYANSTLKLSPEPLRPGPLMTTNRYYREHDDRIKSQLTRSIGESTLIAGHKKDVVLTPRLSLLPQRVAIYGWHRQNGQPIQPLSLVHGIEYVDYSHGVRLISRQALVDGVEVDLSQVFADAELSPLVSDEGFVSVRGYL